MNWIKNYVRPKIRSLLGQKRDTPENMWIKDPKSGDMVFYRDLEANMFVFPGSGHHHRMPAEARMKSFFDGGEWEKIALSTVAVDPLKFRDERKYADRLKEAKAKGHADNSIHAGIGQVDGQKMVVMVQDMSFIGGSLGMAAGEAIITSMRKALSAKCPCVIFVASGGARMQEGILSLMQMPRTTIAVQDLRAAGLPYIVVLTNPTTGGVTASYAMLGDVQLAEPNALIGFAGQRVIEQTIREKLPQGFQRSEYLKDHGMVDVVVTRHDMKSTVANIARILMKQPARTTSTALVPA